MANPNQGGQQGSTEHGGGPSTQGAGKTTGQQGSAQGGKEGKQGSTDTTSNDNAGNSRDANKPDNKTAQKNEEAGK